MYQWNLDRLYDSGNVAMQTFWFGVIATIFGFGAIVWVIAVVLDTIEEKIFGHPE